MRRPGSVISSLAGRIKPAIAVVALFIGCASLGPEGAQPSLRAEGLRRTDLPANDGVQWDYVLILENPNRRSATLIQQALTTAWDNVYRGEIEQIRYEIPARRSIRLAKSTIFRRSDFEASGPGNPGRPSNAPNRTDGMWIYWQFLGQHESGGSFILNFDFFPERR